MSGSRRGARSTAIDGGRPSDARTHAEGAVRRFGGLDADSAEGLVLRHDNGSNYAAADFQREIRFIGIESSPSFVRQP